MGAPLESEHLTSLFAIYDKKGEGVMNYDDFISEQKFIHAVSTGILLRHKHAFVDPEGLYREFHGFRPLWCLKFCSNNV